MRTSAACRSGRRFLFSRATLSMRAPSFPPDLVRDVARRRTFAIISHPDAGKTTLTEKLLLFGGAIQLAGTVKARKSARHATSDWMEVEKQRGISVTSSVMQFDYAGHTINLLDTPGHEDFSEDTYRVLTAVDAAVMVIDAAKGVEAQTIKLLEVCRLRDTPIITFVNKMDREVREPLALLEEIESVLGDRLRADHLADRHGQGVSRRVRPAATTGCCASRRARSGVSDDTELIEGLDNPRLDELFPDEMAAVRHDVELLRSASPPFDLDEFLAGEQTPVFFGSGDQQLRRAGDPAGADRMGAAAAAARRRHARSCSRPKRRSRGFVFKIQANMDPKHRDRIAFFRVCSGRYAPAMKVRHLRDRPRDEARQRADVHGERARGERGRGRRRHHRHPQPRPAADRRHADRGRGARVQGHSVFRAGAVPRRAAARSVQGEAAREGAAASWARKARSRCSRPSPATRCCSARSARCSSRSSRIGSRPSTRSTRSTRARTSRPRAGSPIPTRRCAATSSASRRRRIATDVDGNPVFLATNKYNLQVTMERWPKVGFHATREHGERIEQERSTR